VNTPDWAGQDVDTRLRTIPESDESWLRVQITLYPSTDHLSTPVLSSWTQLFDCVDIQ
jgi:hypothetical protein